MEQDVLISLNMKDREEVVSFLKNLWNEQPEPCPFCGGKLEFLHKKAKKNNCDWICTVCHERFDTIKILNNLNEK